ncbi:hypothetical protein OG866_02210 [Streptomyces sp. NBC_00663]|uniref:hypothetical protein n=1 Tax=Streptomyces sp. NBC_00663 TaxID=2975801 RepID=UPI002E356641|nr:hypothetical protein [Streptomyces sp. NBC_00663]
MAPTGEFVLPIGPMPLPDATSDETNNDTLKLFTARARAARPSFELCDDNRAEVLALCRRLEGIPPGHRAGRGTPARHAAGTDP